MLFETKYKIRNQLDDKTSKNPVFGHLRKILE